jgi:hypothetical protein
MTTYEIIGGGAILVGLALSVLAISASRRLKRLERELEASKPTLHAH